MLRDTLLIILVVFIIIASFYYNTKNSLSSFADKIEYACTKGYGFVLRGNTYICKRKDLLWAMEYIKNRYLTKLEDKE